MRHGKPGSRLRCREYESASQKIREALVCPFFVELARRFANRADLLEAYERVLTRCGNKDQPIDDVLPKRPANYSPRARLLTERFTPDDLEAIITDYQNGMRQRDVVAKYGIGTTTLKKLLRRVGARRCDK